MHPLRCQETRSSAILPRQNEPNQKIMPTINVVTATSPMDRRPISQVKTAARDREDQCRPGRHGDVYAAEIGHQTGRRFGELIFDVRGQEKGPKPDHEQRNNSEAPSGPAGQARNRDIEVDGKQVETEKSGDHKAVPRGPNQPADVGQGDLSVGISALCISKKLLFQADVRLLLEVVQKALARRCGRISGWPRGRPRAPGRT